MDHTSLAHTTAESSPALGGLHADFRSTKETIASTPRVSGSDAQSPVARANTKKTKAIFHMKLHVRFDGIIRPIYSVQPSNSNTKMTRGKSSTSNLSINMQLGTPLQFSRHVKVRALTGRELPETLKSLDHTPSDHYHRIWVARESVGANGINRWKGGGCEERKERFESCRGMEYTMHSTNKIGI